MSSAPPLPDRISLIPNSGLQFLDFAFDPAAVGRLSMNFREVPGDTDRQWVLRPLEETPDGDGLFDPVDQLRLSDRDEFYTVDKTQALAPFLDQWVPVPVLRFQANDSFGRPLYDPGPTNWARLWVGRVDGNEGDGGAPYRAVLAFDTELVPQRPALGYLGPEREDSELEREFHFVHRPDDIAWFLNEGWMEQWLIALHHRILRRRKKGRPLTPEDFDQACWHFAAYLTFLKLIAACCRPPAVKLVDTVSEEPRHTPVDVDLVLDIGNSRTCGILVESYSRDSFDLNQSYVLALRDLSRPHAVYREPFESRVEFAEARFGRETLSRRSRRVRAFAWASPVRVGPEAGWLASRKRTADGLCGLSSPKRYLWDSRPSSQLWHFNAAGEPTPDGAEDPDAAPGPRPVGGPIMGFVTDEGDVIRQLAGTTAGADATFAMRAGFCRSSLFTFMLHELLLQAISQINAVDQRLQRRFSDAPRRLRRVILTVPSALPLAELRILRDRAEGAVKLCWDALGWSEDAAHGPTEPQVLIDWDEASAAQILYLYAEIRRRYGEPARLFGTLGQVREGFGREPSLRVASIDIGGGTTDLMITTFALEAGTAITPRQEFREGFRIAGDDILEAVVERHVLPAIETGLADAGIAEPRTLLQELFSGDRAGLSEQEKHARQIFVTQVLNPVALALLSDYEGEDSLTDRPAFERAFADCFPAGAPPDETLAYVETAARRRQPAEAEPFALAALRFHVAPSALAGTIASVVDKPLADLCEVVAAYGCDLLLLTGRPSRLAAVRDAVQCRLPVPPDRIVPLHRYLVGEWYPFRDAAGRIRDPKTTAAVGAMLCVLAEGRIEGMLIRTSRLHLRSTARFVGVMDNQDQIPADKVLVRDLGLEEDAEAMDEEPATVEMFTPVTLGMRQLPIARWTATPLYHLDFAEPETVPRLALPLAVELKRQLRGRDTVDEASKEDFRIQAVTDAEGRSRPKGMVTLRLKTISARTDSYWLDSGILTVGVAGSGTGTGSGTTRENGA